VGGEKDWLRAQGLRQTKGENRGRSATACSTNGAAYSRKGLARRQKGKGDVKEGEEKLNRYFLGMGGS